MRSSLLFFLLVVLLLIFTLSVSINIYPEFFFYPWLVAKGLVPYRDFFDHHGFLLYYLLAPFALNKSLTGINTVFIGIQLLNLALIWSIIRKNQRLLNGFLLGLLYILLNIFFVENTIWYEQFILTGYLGIYLLTHHQLPYKKLWIGFIVVLVSFIKPTAAIILIPLLIIGYWQSSAVFLLAWLCFMMYLLSRSLLQPLIQDLFVFNGQFSHYLISHYSFMNDKTVLVIIGLFLTVIISIHLHYHRTRQSLMALLFVTSSLFFLYPTYDRKHMVVFVSLLVVYISTLNFSSKKLSQTFPLVISSFIIVCLFWVMPHIRQLQHRLTYVEENGRNFYAPKPFYVLGNSIEMYYFRDQLPPTYYPLLLPGFTESRPTIETTIINDLELKQPFYVIMPLPANSNYINLKKLRTYITHHYVVTQSTHQYQILKRFQ